VKGWFGTLVLVAALLTAFAFSWRSGALRETPRVQAASAPVVVQARSKPEPQVQARKVVPLPTYGGYPCASSDCAEDKAGFRWAERNVVSDPDSCAGNTSEFVEGCRVYVERSKR
jgi:hypothetical protein